MEKEENSSKKRVYSIVPASVGVVNGIVDEIKKECNPLHLCKGIDASDFKLTKYIHIPYFPAFHQPGWMLRYIIGPFDEEWVETLIADTQAGFTVLMTLIPQVTLINFWIF
jgi:hypothetical protein